MIVGKRSNGKCRLRNAGWFLGGIFLLGFFSNHIRRLPDILMWAENLGNIHRAYKYRHAYDDLSAWEKQQAEQERRAREETARQNTGTSSRQNAWREDAKRHREQDSAQGNEYERERGGAGTAQTMAVRGSTPTQNQVVSGMVALSDTHICKLSGLFLDGTTP
jgi:hypothetical protein